MGRSGAKLEFCGAGVVYGAHDQPLEACSAVTFEVLPGQSVALIGPSGCGKSTVLSLAAGLLAPTSGQVLVNGAPLAGPRAETAYIPQNLGLFPWKTVLQNAALGLRLHGVSRGEACDRARQALEAVGLGGFEGAYPAELSGGMQQRLALARVLAMQADLLLMDEPLSAIDALLREGLQDMLLDFWRRESLTQVLVTHSIEEAVFLGQRIIVFSGRPGTVAAQVDNPQAASAGWRDSAGFAERCREVRAALATAQGAGDPGAAFPGGGSA